MRENQIKAYDLEAVLLEFHVEAEDRPSPALLEAYCRTHPQFARELTDYALAWLIEEATAVVVPADEAPASGTSPLVSRAISRLHDRFRERERSNDVGTRSPGQRAVDPFEGLPLRQVRAIRDELGIDTPLFAKFRNRLIDPDTVPAEFLGRLAGLLERTIEELTGYLHLPPTVHVAADFKAETKPAVTDERETFEDALRRSSLDEAKKRQLLGR